MVHRTYNLFRCVHVIKRIFPPDVVLEIAWKNDRRRKRRRPPAPSMVSRLTDKWLDGEQNVQVPQELWHGMSVTDKLAVYVIIINHLILPNKSKLIQPHLD